MGGEPVQGCRLGAPGDDGRLKRACGDEPDQVERDARGCIGTKRAVCENIDGVAVVGRVRRADGVCIGVGCHLGDFGCLRFGEAGIGDDAGNGGVRAVERHGDLLAHGEHRLFHVDDLESVSGGAHAGNRLEGGGVDYVAHGVHGRHRAHLQAAKLEGACAESRLHAALGSAELADGGSGASAHAPFGEWEAFGRDERFADCHGPVEVRGSCL